MAQYSNTMLMYAAQNGLVDVMKREIEEFKVDVNAPDKWGNTPLTSAIRYKQEEAVKYLIEKGADVNQSREADTLSPLQMAKRVKSPEIEKTLIQAGARDQAAKPAILPTNTLQGSISLLQAARKQPQMQYATSLGR